MAGLLQRVLALVLLVVLATTVGAGMAAAHPGAVHAPAVEQPAHERHEHRPVAAHDAAFGEAAAFILAGAQSPEAPQPDGHGHGHTAPDDCCGFACNAVGTGPALPRLDGPPGMPLLAAYGAVPGVTLTPAGPDRPPRPHRG